MLFYYGDYRIIKNFYQLKGDSFEGYNILKIDHNETNRSIDQSVLLSTNIDSEEILYVDFKESRVLQGIYNRAVKEIREKEKLRKLSDLEKILIFGKELERKVRTNKTLPTKFLDNDYLLDHKILKLTEKLRDKAMTSVDMFINSGYMYCRHYALAGGVLIERAIKEGILNGDLELNGNFYPFNNSILMGHIWIRYNNEKEKYIIDFMKKNYFNISSILKFEEVNDYIDQISYLKKLPSFDNIYQFFSIYGNYWDYKKPEESPEFKRYFRFIRDIKNNGKEIVHRKRSVLNKVYLDPWHDDAIYVTNNLVVNTIKNNVIKKFKDKKPTMNEILDEVYFQFVEFINKYYPEKNYSEDPLINASKIISLSDSKFNKENSSYTIREIYSLIKNKKIDSRVAHLIIASAVELLQKEKEFKNLLQGRISIERDDTSLERGKCFFMFYPKKDRPYVIDVVHYKSDYFPDEEILRELIFFRKNSLPLLWILRENY